MNHHHPQKLNHQIGGGFAQISKSEVMVLVTGELDFQLPKPHILTIPLEASSMARHITQNLCVLNAEHGQIM